MRGKARRRKFSPYINHFLQPDTLTPVVANPQGWNRYSYVLNNPIRNTDPSGHRACSSDEECKELGVTPSGQTYLNLKGYSSWEKRILRKLYDEGGKDAERGVQYILANDIHISIGDYFVTYDMRGTRFGDWQSVGSVAGWYEPGNNAIVLNPNAGYNNSMPSAWGLATIIHEAKHLEQGRLTKYGELEAWQIGFRVAEKLGHYGSAGITENSIENSILKLPLNSNPSTINQFSNYVHDYDSGYYFFFQFLEDR